MAIASGGPDWASIMTGIGTVGAVVVAVFIALWVDLRTGKRLEEERKYSDEHLAEERKLSADQIEEERRIAKEREQLIEAFAVRVGAEEKPSPSEKHDEVAIKRLGVFVVNRSRYAITHVEARFSTDGKSLVPPHRSERVAGPVQVVGTTTTRGKWEKLASEPPAMTGVLTPWDNGLVFESDDIHVQSLVSPYPVVRWKDQWGTRWEYKHGQVRQITDSEEWAP